ncbi:WD40 repeat-like protein [Cutaneotrichosporon oleaginosum]|uniref:WD repeat-containing protein JIP5 n=1 Tax=Cutaneotrichosporon oleaginosum TaxID=879819 RepID=A0A0J0XEC6_9TREE|nr:WD40 repeat-like protein [Cutaneotrichosporon oleaginosum]KLT39420.1 WD40 repeat-like protein [Cutaneotrichosporon oleaginosum]TXT15377.1 hypothetical protein COLE_01570 [Cutaneotrichosporon oleaginosum]
MPEIKLRNQPFDVAFSPRASVLCAALLTGEIKAWTYDDAGATTTAWSARPTKRTARALHFSPDGNDIWMGGKSGIIAQLDASTGAVKWHAEAHAAPVNRVHVVNPQLVASGDDDGVIKFWDARAPSQIREYTQHWDYISDFAYFEDRRLLVATSGDGHLSAIDIRRNKAEPAHLSADQEDELLSVCPIKGGEKFVVGTGLGVLSVWDRSKGWEDGVDRMLGHPASVDAVVALSEDIVATGSEDGMVRVIQVQPNSFLGVIATHDEYPIERLALDRSAKWLASVSHDECIKLTDCEGMFEDDSGAEDVEMGDEEEEGDAAMDEDSEDDDSDNEPAQAAPVDWGSDSDDDKPQRKKKVRKGQHKVGKERVNEEAGFFDDL